MLTTATESHVCDPVQYSRAYEEDLIDFFPDLVADIEFEQVGVKMHENNPVLHPEAYGFLALGPSIGYVIPPGHTTRTLMSSGHVNLATASPDVDFFYPGGKAFLDTWKAIGLTYLSKLVAVGGAGIDNVGHLKIAQLQDVSGAKKKGRGSDYYKTGLHNGLDWRKTLVRALEHIAGELGLNEVLILSSSNITYGAVTEMLEAGTVTNDEVADKLGYNPDLVSGNWFRNLTN